MADSTTLTSDTTTLVNTGSTSYISGTSGFDSSALIEAAVQKKMQPAYVLEAEITKGEASLAAYDEMNGGLGTLQDTLSVLRNEPGTLGAESVFETKTAYLSSATATAAENHLGVDVAAGTPNGSYNVEVQQTATAQKLGAAAVADSTAALGLTGDFQLSTGAGAPATISVTSTMSLQDLEASINAQADTTGVQASVLQISSTEAILVLTAMDTGQSINYASTAGADIGLALGITAADGSYLNELQAATDSIVVVDGVPIQRSTNTVDDAISGITLDLYAAAPGATFKVDIDQSYAASKDAIVAFVDAYNSYRDFALVHQETSYGGAPTDSAVLFGDGLLRNANNSIYSALTRNVSTSNGSISIADLGLSFDASNHLVIDESALDSALLNSFDDVATLFEFQFTSSDPDLQVLAHEKSVPSGSHVLDIQVDGTGAMTAVTVDGQSDQFMVKGNVIEGAQGSAYEGFKMVYTGTQATTVTFAASQGIADQLNNDIESYVNEVNGSLTLAQQGLEQSNETKAERITSIEGKAAAYEKRLINYYAALEAKIAEANSMKSLLESIYSNSK